MTIQNIHNPLDYSASCRLLEITDPGHANTFNPLFERLINNDAFLKSYVDTKIEELINGSPEALDTLKELAAALGNNENFSTMVLNAIAAKVSQTEFDEHKAESVKQTTKNINYYVNASTGNDSNDGLTTATAFKTIQYAINLIPQVMNHSIIINMATGIYNDPVQIKGFIGYGTIEVKGATTISNDYEITGNIIITGCFCGVTVRGIKSRGIYIARCANVALRYITKIFAADVDCDSSTVYVSGSILSNATYGFGIVSKNLAVVLSENNTGSGNLQGLNAQTGGTIIKSGTQPSGTTAETVSSGGVIR